MMELRPIQLPGDLVPVMQATTEIFQYPDHPEWSIQEDERAHITRSIRNLRRMWPVLRALQPFAPQLRDMFRGYVWEDGGKIVGVATAAKLDATQTWLIGAVGLEPERRGQGYARRMLQATLDLIKARGGRKVRLGMFSGNLPARALYERLGFHVYDGTTGFEAAALAPRPCPPTPGGYSLLPLGRFDWKPRLELDQRICPPQLQEFEPLAAARYREPLVVRALVPLMLRAQGLKDEHYLIARTSDGRIVGRIGCEAIVRGSGPNNVSARIDPACPELAEFALNYALHRAADLAPNRRTKFGARRWMTGLIDAAPNVGLELRRESLSLGLVLQTKEA